MLLGMQDKRAGWIVTVSIGTFLVLFFLVIEFALVFSIGWINYSVGFIAVRPTYIYEERVRFLWAEKSIAPGSIFFGLIQPILPFQYNQTFNKAVQPILNTRLAVPIMQVIVLLLVSLTLVGLLVKLVMISCRPAKHGQRAAQFTVLIGGALLWFFALVYFTSLLVYLHGLTIENLHLDEKLISARSSWPQFVRDETRYSLGAGILLSIASVLGLYLGSASFLLAATLQQPPTISRIVT